MPTTGLFHHDLTIAAGTIVDRRPPELFALDSSGLAHRPAFVYEDHSSGGTRFVNAGSVAVVLDPSVTDPYGELIGFAVSPLSATSTNALFHSTVGARFVVDSRWTDGAGIQTYGFYAADRSIAFLHEGTFEVRAAAGHSYGYYAGGLAGSSVSSSGILRVTSVLDAFGVYAEHSSPFANTGSVVVRGGELAVGLFWGTVLGSNFHNAGAIAVTAAATSPYASIGLYLGDSGSSAYELLNSGTITADIAIYAGGANRSGELAPSVAQHLINSGTIRGAVMLAAGDDTVSNDGLMTGATLAGGRKRPLRRFGRPARRQRRGRRRQ